MILSKLLPKLKKHLVRAGLSVRGGLGGSVTKIQAREREYVSINVSSLETSECIYTFSMEGTWRVIPTLARVS